MLTYISVWWTKQVKRLHKRLYAHKPYSCSGGTAEPVFLIHVHTKNGAAAAALRISIMRKKNNHRHVTDHRRILMEFPVYELASTFLDVMPVFLGGANNRREKWQKTLQGCHS